MAQKPAKPASKMADLATCSPTAPALRDNSQPSILYTMLPSPVQRRIPQMSSIRRSLSAYSIQANEEATVARRSWTGGLDVGFVEDSSVATSCESSPCRSRSSISMTPPSADGAPLGREMRHAVHGINLLEAMVAEAQDPDARSRAFARQQYVHSVAYLLHGLPQDLEDHEAVTLEKALPLALQEPSMMNDVSVKGRSAVSSSLPRRVIVAGIVQLFLLCQIFLPYIQVFLKSAYEYNRIHRITERALTASASTLACIGKRGVELVGNILRSGNGRGVQIVAALSLWWIQEVSSGIHEGVENCLEITDKQISRPAIEKRRQKST